MCERKRINSLKYFYLNLKINRYFSLYLAIDYIHELEKEKDKHEQDLG